jgi:hypothetical protein
MMAGGICYVPPLPKESQTNKEGLEVVRLQWYQEAQPRENQLGALLLPEVWIQNVANWDFQANPQAKMDYLKHAEEELLSI